MQESTSLVHIGKGENFWCVSQHTVYVEFMYILYIAEEDALINDQLRISFWEACVCVCMCVCVCEISVIGGYVVLSRSQRNGNVS